MESAPYQREFLTYHYNHHNYLATWISSIVDRRARQYFSLADELKSESHYASQITRQQYKMSSIASSCGEFTAGCLRGWI
jgi:hypothetical protein